MFHKTIGYLAAGILLVNAAGARSRKMIRVDEHSSGQEVHLQVGDTLEVSLAENPTAGFRWKLVSQAEPACQLVGSEFVPGKGAPGRGGIHHWRFQAVRAGAGRIEMDYRRPWEQDASPSRVFTLRAKVIEKAPPPNPKPSG